MELGVGVEVKEVFLWLIVVPSKSAKWDNTQILIFKSITRITRVCVEYFSNDLEEEMLFLLTMFDLIFVTLQHSKQASWG